MPHGQVTVWYGKDNTGTGTESGLKNGVRIEGTFRMGRPHGHARVIDLTSEDEKVLYDGKFLNGRPMDAGDEVSISLFMSRQMFLKARSLKYSKSVFLNRRDASQYRDLEHYRSQKCIRKCI